MERLSLEIFLLRWLVVPTVLTLGIYVFLSTGNARSKCSEACSNKGFSGERYVPTHARSGNLEDKCYCLTEKETKFKKRIPAGAKINDW